MPTLLTRYLEISDIPALLELEQSKWEAGQSACANTLRQRIEAYPELCIGCFCADTGEALASLFMRPISPVIFTAPTRWDVAATMRNADSMHDRSRSLFGISLSSKDAGAVTEIFRFFYPRALKSGWRDIYLGSPIPGFKRARQRNPDLFVWKYVHTDGTSRIGQPRDPQLKYYFRKGFRQVVSIQEDYFPHAESMNYGVILRGVIPLSKLRALWKLAPLSLLKSMSTIVFRSV